MTLVVGVLLLSWILGRSSPMPGGLVGVFVGAFAGAGLASTAGRGALATMYTPGELAAAALPVAAVAGGLVLAAPHVIGFASAGWATGAVFAAIASIRINHRAYVLPLIFHAVVAALLVCMARRRGSGHL